MTKSTITREQLLEIIETDHVQCGEASYLARMALAAMDSEPVAWTWQHLKQWHVTNDEARARDLAWDGVKVEPLYRHAQSAPVVPEEKSIPNTLSMCAVDAVAAIAEVKGWNACRAAMLQELKKSAGTEAICRSDENVHVLHTKSPAQSDCCPAQNVVVPAQSPIDHGYLPECECSGCKATARICAELAGNSQVIPDGYVMVPMRLTAENGAKGALSGEFSETKFVNCPECFGDDECETCDGSGRIEITVPVTWTTIKEIWAKGVEHFAAAPQSPGSEPATVPGKWIPVSERMPDREVDVQVYCPDKKEQMVAYLERNELEGYFRFATWRTGDGIYCQPTHWMQLPAGPREVKGE